VAAPALSTMTDGKAPGMAIPNNLVALASANAASALDPTSCMGTCTGMQSGDSGQGIVPGAMGAAAPFGGGGSQCNRDFGGGGLTPSAWQDVCDEAQALGKSIGQWIVDSPEAALTLCSMVPAIGVPCSLVLAGIDLSRGDYLGAGLAVGMILLPGGAMLGGRLIGKMLRWLRFGRAAADEAALRAAVEARYSAITTEGSPDYQTNTVRGPVLSGVMDRKTGGIFFGQNSRNLPPNLHPDIAARLPGVEPMPYGGRPGTHAEVHAANQALGARPGATMEDLLIYNVRLRGARRGLPIERCPPCQAITAGAQEAT
jgi:hypothetical protein